MKFLKLTLLSSALSLTACSSIYDKHVEWEVEKPEEYPVIHAIGYAPISLQRAESQTQKMLMAIEASKVSAYAELAEQVYGQQVSKDVTVSDMLLSNKHLTASVQGVIRGAKVVKSYPVGDTYTTELEVDFKKVYDLYITINKPKKIKEITYY